MSDQRHNLSADDSYLWDGTGPVDADVKKFEEALRPMAFKPMAVPVVRRPALRWAIPLAAAAAVLITAIVWKSWTPKPPAPPPTWAIVEKSGSPAIGDPEPFKSEKLQTQRLVQTDVASSVKLGAGTATRFTLESSSAAHVVDGTDNWPWISLEKGTAVVEVPQNDRPVLIGLFGETAAVQPGAQASIALTERGAEIRPDRGEVWIDWKGTQTRLAAPSMITIDSVTGPNLPSVFTKSKDLFDAISNFEQLLIKTNDSKVIDVQLNALLNAMSRREAMLVWNLLARVEPSQRRQVRDRLAKLINEPQGIDRDAILKLEPKAMDAWWRAAVDAARTGK